MSHVESVAVSLGHLLLKLLIREPKETRKSQRGGGGSQGMNANPNDRATTKQGRHISSEMHTSECHFVFSTFWHVLTQSPPSQLLSLGLVWWSSLRKWRKGPTAEQETHCWQVSNCPFLINIGRCWHPSVYTYISNICLERCHHLVSILPSPLRQAPARSLCDICFQD